MTYNGKPEEHNLLQQRNIPFYPVTSDSNETVNNSRIFPAANFIATLVDKYDVASLERLQ